MEGMRSLMNSIRSEDNESQFGTGEYIIRRNHDTITNADYYDLIGRLTMDVRFCCVHRLHVSNRLCRL